MLKRLEPKIPLNAYWIKQNKNSKNQNNEAIKRRVLDYTKNCWQTVSLWVCELNCELLGNSKSELTAIWGFGNGRKWSGQRGGNLGKTEFGQDAAISVEEEAIFLQSYRPNHVPVKPCPQSPKTATVAKIGDCRRKRRLSPKTATVAIFGELWRLSPFWVTVAEFGDKLSPSSNSSRQCGQDFTLTLDARPPGYHRVQVWSQSIICPREEAIFVR